MFRQAHCGCSYTLFNKRTETAGGKNMDGSGSKCHIKILLHALIFFVFPYNVMLPVYFHAKVVAYLCFQFQHVALAISLAWGNTSYTCVWTKKPLSSQICLVYLRYKATVTVTSSGLEVGFLILIRRWAKKSKCKNMENKKGQQKHHMTKFLQGKEKKLCKEDKWVHECSTSSSVWFIIGVPTTAGRYRWSSVLNLSLPRNVCESNAELFWWQHPLPVYMHRLHCWLRNAGIKHAALTDSCTAVAFLTCQTRTRARWRLERISENCTKTWQESKPFSLSVVLEVKNDWINICNICICIYNICIYMYFVIII